MRKRILAMVLTLATLVTSLSVVASAVPYSPSANAWKDFGQQHNYIYEVNQGKAAPKADGKVTDADGYGDPIATFGFRYVSTADKVREELANGEYKLQNNGDYYVYPTTETPKEIWSSITSFEVDNPNCYIYTYRYQATSFSSSSTYYFAHPKTHEFVRAYKVTSGTFKKYTHLDSAGNIVLQDPTLLTQQPADWETSFDKYYTKKTTTGYVAVASASTTEKVAPAWKENTYYTGTRTVVTELFTTATGTPGAIATLANLKNFRVILPEKVNVYARYNNQYLYYAVEVVEDDHKSAFYNMYNWFGTSMSNSPAAFADSSDYGNAYKMTTDGKVSSTLSSTIRTYANVAATIKTTAPILAKFGNPGATYNEVQVAGTDYNITHTAYVPPVKTDDNDGDFSFDDFGGEEAVEDDIKSSGTYGTTVYEYRVPWAVINGKYNPETSKTAVPEQFTIRQEIQLENRLGGSAYRLAFSMPRTTNYLPGGLARSGGTYPNDLSVFRYMDDTGLAQGDTYGTYNFRWACTTNPDISNKEFFVTDYFTVGSKKTFSFSHFPPVFFTAGKEPAEEYAVPQYAGAQIRADGEDGQKIRIKFSVSGTEKEIKEAGVLVAPTEVVRRQQLKLGISSVQYYAEENPVLYGVVNGQWINLATDAITYFGATAMPNDADSYLAYDEYGGKPSGIYTVYNLKVDLNDPYEVKSNVYGEETVTYAAVFAGAKDEGLFNDFDDYNTFYTFRPYIKYEDGTVVYGEQEYKSLYYLAAWQIQEILSEYNSSHGYSENTTAFNMDMMPLTTVKDAAGNTLKDADGNYIYLPAINTSSSPYSGARERSIYLAPRRLEVFRWYAVKLVSRRNGNTPLRYEEYEKFDANTKSLVDNYTQLLENVWKVVVTGESNRYYTKPLQ